MTAKNVRSEQCIAVQVSWKNLGVIQEILSDGAVEVSHASGCLDACGEGSPYLLLTYTDPYGKVSTFRHGEYLLKPSSSLGLVFNVKPDMYDSIFEEV